MDTVPTENAVVRPGSRLRMVLFVAGREPNSELARENLAGIGAGCGERWEVEIVDVLENYEAALRYNVLVTPCLVVVEPEPRVTIVGTLRDAEKVKAALRLG
jgi:hypothetical protein